ncbi:hypothetical protein PENCOP_c007G05920 [Penicillium coprophilum]|uniref:Uncharacterized protein n=1 Tax=Penicillium coprophilum TaxID=36646 RepID=A0A1V6ULS0_9EURO|nr:hypothetical protein PENCOP_c007G05920 [Penicillium coprophilum]
MSGIEILPSELILQSTLFSSESSLAALERTNRYLQQLRHRIGGTILQDGHTTEGAGCRRPFTQDTGPGKISRGRSANHPVRDQRFAHVHNFRPHLISLATRAGHLHIVRYMIDRGVSPKTESPQWFTLLALAATHGHVFLAEYLLHVGAK